MSDTNDTTTGAGLLREWQQAVKARDEAISERLNNMFMPPIGLEEAQRITNQDINQLNWFLDKALKILAAKEDGESNE